MPYVIKSTDIVHTSFTKLQLYFHKVSCIINTLIPPFRETLYAGRIKLFAEASKLADVVFRSSPSNKTVLYQRILQGAKKIEVVERWGCEKSGL